MKKSLVFVLGLLVFLAGCGKASVGKYDGFAQCLADSDATFYGAFWCPHCNTQKEMFGDSVKLLPYVECSTSDGKAQKEICKQEGIKSYPTWEFADGERSSGTVSLDVLAEKTGCELP